MTPLFLPPAIAMGVIGVASGFICMDSAFKDDRHLTIASGIICVATLTLAVILAVI